MEKIWFIRIGDGEEGPFDILELRGHPRVTPDTLVRKDGSNNWVPMRSVAELKDVFADAQPSAIPDENELKEAIQVEKEELILDVPYDSPPFFFWLLIMLIVLGYACYLLYWTP